MDHFGWIDFSQDHRDRVNSVLDLFLEEGVVDELGVGVIRDALSDEMFPGISTIQTRAKYFFLIPYIIKDYCLNYDSLNKKTTLRKYLFEEENKLIWRYAEKYRNTNEIGIIGITMQDGQLLARKPSSIYWYGILTHGFIKSELSLEGYLSKFERKSADSLKMILKGDDSSIDDSDAEYEDLFAIKVPYTKNWSSSTDISLTYDEADFLKNRFIDNHSDKLLGVISKDPKLTAEFLLSKSFDDFCLKIFNSNSHVIPLSVLRIIQLAYDFNRIMVGAHIRYNCILQEKYGTKGSFDDEWNQWKENINNEAYDLQNFDTEYLFFIASRTKEMTRSFVTSWINAVKSGNFDINYLNHLVSTQEKLNKKSKSRLRIGVEESINDWIGLKYLSYRFDKTHQMIADIESGLNLNS